jgi:hypothetical protein
MQMHRNLSQAPEAVANTANLPCEVKCFWLSDTVTQLPGQDSQQPPYAIQQLEMEMWSNAALSGLMETLVCLIELICELSLLFSQGTNLFNIA